MEREKTCCFTGHRPEKLPWRFNEGDPRCMALKERIAAGVERAYDAGCRHFVCGMARGADFYFCEAVLELRGHREGITMEAAVPCRSQANSWREEDQRRYIALLHQCDLETLIQENYDRGCMQRRNRYMVDRSRRILAAYDGMGGGTGTTLAYAMRKGLEVDIIEIGEDR